MLYAEGTVCDRAFLSQRALRIHQAKTLGGEHGQPDVASQIVVTNQCLFCRRVFATRRHVQASLLHQACSGRGSAIHTTPASPDSLDCPICSHVCATLDELHSHLAEHLELATAISPS